MTVYQLGITDHPDSNNLNRKRMLEMDRFVTELTGEGEQTLDRESRSSLATMKDTGNLER